MRLTTEAAATNDAPGRTALTLVIPFGTGGGVMWDSRLLTKANAAKSAPISNAIDGSSGEIGEKKGDEEEEEEEEEEENEVKGKLQKQGGREEEGSDEEHPKEGQKQEEEESDSEFSSEDESEEGNITSDDDNSLESDETDKEGDFGNRITKSKLEALRTLPAKTADFPAHVGSHSDAGQLLNTQVRVVPSVNLPVFLAGAVKPVVVDDASVPGAGSGPSNHIDLISTFGSRPTIDKLRGLQQNQSSSRATQQQQRPTNIVTLLSNFGSRTTSKSIGNPQPLPAANAGADLSILDSFGSRDPALTAARDKILNAVHWNQPAPRL